jgi:hypothetical protein
MPAIFGLSLPLAVIDVGLPPPYPKVPLLASSRVSVQIPDVFIVVHAEPVASHF